MFVHRGCLGPVRRGIFDGASDEGFCGGESDRSGWRVGGGGSCFRQFVSDLVAWLIGPDEDDGAFSVIQSLAYRLSVICATPNS